MFRKVISLLFFISFFIPAAFAQNAGGNFTEKVIEIKNFSNVKHAQLIAGVLDQYAEGSSLMLACEEQGWVVLRINLTEVKDDEQLEVVLKLTGLECIVKNDASRKDVSAACKGDLTKY